MKNEMKMGVYERNGENVQFGFSTFLSAYEKLNFVNSVVDVVVTDSSYNYIIKDMVFDFNIIRFFTDVDLSEIVESDNNIDAIEEFLNETNVVEIVKMNATLGVIDELMEAVDFNIEYKTGIHTNLIASSLSSLLNTIDRKIEDIDLSSLMGFADAMSGVSGELTAEKIVEAYGKSDLRKTQYKEIFEKLEKRNDMTGHSIYSKNDNDGFPSPVLSPDYEV